MPTLTFARRFSVAPMMECRRRGGKRFKSLRLDERRWSDVVLLVVPMPGELRIVSRLRDDRVSLRFGISSAMRKRSRETDVGLSHVASSLPTRPPSSSADRVGIERLEWVQSFGSFRGQNDHSRRQSGAAANDPYETSAILNVRHASEHFHVGLRGRSCLAEAAA